MQQEYTYEPIAGRMPSTMLPEGTALVLEGGGLRGFFSGGVFEAFMDAGIMFPYIIAVSAGVANAMSYISGQRGRNRQVVEHFAADPRYVSKRNLLRSGSLFGMDFVFHEVPQKHIFWDRDVFERQNIRFLTGAFDCLEGRTVWFEKQELEPPGIEAVMASCAIPLLSPIRRINGYHLLDGGVADPIPIEQSIADGNRFHVIVLTQPEGYRREAFEYMWLMSLVYRNYPKLVDAIRTRHGIYNRQLELCERLERERKAIIIRPKKSSDVSCFGSDTNSLLTLYDEGHEAGKAKLHSIRAC